MRLQSMIAWVCLAAAVPCLSACGVQYNGGLSLKGSDRGMVESYHRFLKDRDLALEDATQAKAEAVQAEADIATNRSGMVPSANLPLPPQPAAPAPAASPVFAKAPVPAAPAEAVPQLVADRSMPERTNPGASGFDLPVPELRDGMDNVQRVTFATEGADFDPAVTPDGQHLVFASTRHRANADLYIKRIGASAVTQLTNDPGKDMMPAVSPDGKLVAFASSRSGNWDIYLTDIAGGQPIQLTNDPAAEIHPSFSFDGKWLVYCQLGEQSGQWELVLIELANPAVKRFIGYGLFPNWSPVADRIVFQRARERGTRWYSVWTIDLVNGEAMRPTEIAASANCAVITPDWSPDGRHIVFCTVMAQGQDKAKQSDVWVVDVDGRNRTNLTRSRFANLQPIWASDGSIFFTSNRSLADGENVWSLRPDHALQVARRVIPGTSATADSGAELSDKSTAQATE